MIDAGYPGDGYSRRPSLTRSREARWRLHPPQHSPISCVRACVRACVQHGCDTVRAYGRVQVPMRSERAAQTTGEATRENRDTRGDRRIHERSRGLSCVFAGAAAWCLVRACLCLRNHLNPSHQQPTQAPPLSHRARAVHRHRVIRPYDAHLRTTSNDDGRKFERVTERSLTVRHDRF